MANDRVEEEKGTRSLPRKQRLVVWAAFCSMSSLAVSLIIFAGSFTIFRSGVSPFLYTGGLSIVGIILGAVALGVRRDGSSSKKLLGRASLVSGAIALVSVVLMWCEVIPSSYSRVLTQRDRVACRMQVQNILTRLLAYETENGNFPPDLETLVSSGFLSMDDLRCPGRHAKNDVPGSSYAYIGGQSIQSPAANLLLYEKVACDGSAGGVICLVGGTISYAETRREIERMIQQTEMRMKQNG